MKIQEAFEDITSLRNYILSSKTNLEEENINMMKKMTKMHWK